MKTPRSITRLLNADLPRGVRVVHVSTGKTYRAGVGLESMHRTYRIAGRKVEPVLEVSHVATAHGTHFEVEGGPSFGTFAETTTFLTHHYREAR